MLMWGRMIGRERSEDFVVVEIWRFGAWRKRGNA